jgi:hypothetical protein
MGSLKLAINPCPAGLSHQTLHNILSPWVWKKLRMMRDARFCEICDWRQSDKPRGHDLRMHEVFDYQIKRRGKSVAYLRDLQFLCNRCHGIVHNGQITAKLIKDAEQRRLTPTRFHDENEAALAKWESTVEHFCNINHCKRDDFFRHAEQAAAEKRERDQRAWRIDWATFDPKDVEEFVVKRAYE